MLVYSQMLISLDGPRLLALGFIPFILMSLNGHRLIAEAGSVDPLWLAALPLSIFAVSMTDRSNNLLRYGGSRFRRASGLLVVAGADSR